MKTLDTSRYQRVKNLCIGAMVALFALLILSCNSSTKPTTGKISGSVLLVNDSGNPDNDPVDFAGITVAIYNLAIVDTALARCNQEHPSIGVIQNQVTVFDHRSASLVASTDTNAAGGFEIANLSPGTYNVALIHENWSLRYVYEVTVQANNATDIGVFQLKRKKWLSGIISEDFTFESNKQYIITEDLNLLGASKIEPDCFINLIPGRNIKFHGSLDTESGYLPGSYWRISSSFGIDSATPAIVGQGDYMGSVNLLYAESNISHGIVTNTDFGLSIQAPQVSVTDISISNVNYGIYALQTTFVMQNVNISGASRYGLSVQNTLATESISITNCIVAHCEDGLSVSGGTFSISNIFLYDCYAAFRPWENTGTIEHCDFDLCYYDIYQYRASCTILYNNFFYNKKLGIFPRNYGLVNYNNFYYTALSYIDIRGLSLSQDLDAKNNYWAVSNLDQYLFDALDNDEFPDEPPCNRYIIYLPKRNSRVITAGIQ